MAVALLDILTLNYWLMNITRFLTFAKSKMHLFHFNGKDSSQIRYFLSNTDIVTSYNARTREVNNTSTHDPIALTCFMEKENEQVCAEN